MPQAETPSQSDSSSLNIGYEAFKAYFDLKQQSITQDNEVESNQIIPVEESAENANERIDAILPPETTVEEE